MKFVDMIRINKIALVKIIDNIIGIFFVHFLCNVYRERADYSNEINRILIIRPGGIGDAVLLIPSILALKKAYPNVNVDILAEKRNGAVFSMCSNVSSVFLYDKPMDLLSVVTRARYDVVVDTEQWHRLSAVIARLMRAPLRIGFATNERKKIFTHGIPYSQDDFESESFYRLLAPFFGEAAPDVKRPFLTVLAPAMQKAEELLRSLQGLRVVAVFPGGSIKERQWGAARFHAVARMLIERGYGIIVVGGREDVESGRRIVSNLVNALDTCGKATLPETAAVLKKASLLITGDSGIMHIAYGLGTPTVSLFGPGIEKKWAPRGENHIVINKHLSCSPCTKFGYTPRCKKHTECMKLIAPEEVFEKAIELLEGKTHAADRH